MHRNARDVNPEVPPPKGAGGSWAAVGRHEWVGFRCCCLTFFPPFTPCIDFLQSVSTLGPLSFSSKHSSSPPSLLFHPSLIPSLETVPSRRAVWMALNWHAPQLLTSPPLMPSASTELGSKSCFWNSDLLISAWSQPVASALAWA